MKKYCLFLFIIVLSINTGAQVRTANGKIIPEAELDSMIVAKMNQFHVAGLSIAIVNKGKIVYDKCFGWKDKMDGPKVDTTSLFEAASLTKPVFAWAFARLIDRKMINIDTPLYKYLEYPDISYDERYKKITARMVMSHTSGFPNWRWNNPDGKLNIKFTPGEKFSYSGEGFEYLGKVMEKLTGMNPEEFIQKEVFIPLRMTRSYFRWVPIEDSLTTIGHDSAYVSQVKWKPTGTSVASGLHTNAHDYIKFLLAVLNKKGVSKKTWNEMMKPQSTIGKDYNAYADEWGLGFALKSTPEGRIINHLGANDWFQSYMEISEKRKDAIIVFTNSNRGLKMMPSIREHIISGK
jgi:CubicO group peptidase (beta-lactamase class C family)